MSRPYDHIAAQWNEHQDPNYLKKVLGYVDKAVANLSSGSMILDLGCGTGDPIAKYLVNRGYRVVGVDESAAMLKIAKTTVPEAELVQADMVEIQFTGRFAGAIAWNSLFHVNRKHHAAIFAKIFDALDPGGKLLLAVGGSDPKASASVNATGDGFTSEMFGHEFYYSGFAPEITRGLLESAGFKIDIWEVDDPSSLGHIAVIARKASLPTFD